MRVLIWFHRDLRTHDHQGLTWALAQGHDVGAVVVAPEGALVAQQTFWRESTAELARQLHGAGIELVHREGPAPAAIRQLMATGAFDQLVTHRRMNFRDQALVRELSGDFQVLTLGELTLFDCQPTARPTLDELRPFTKFKNRVLGHWPIPKALPRPEPLRLPEPAPAPQWSRGGESAGLLRLQDYLWQTKAVGHYHVTRNGLLARDDSSKLSRWLAWGCLSPRLVYQELQRFEEREGTSDGVQALIYELVWRDYFKFLADVMQANYFSAQGLKPHPVAFTGDDHLFRAWASGATGSDFVDAHMRELITTGWMSNRGRQNVASFLAKTLGVDWTRGAEFFAQHLIDYDPESNWGNWLYLAGVGTDPRDRKFDVERQALIYDASGEYRRRW